MTIQEKGRNRENGAAFTNCLRVSHSTTKAAIVRLALWGLIPAGLASWLILRGGMRHE
jgi:hypothetical protein